MGIFFGAESRKNKDQLYIKIILDLIQESLCYQIMQNVHKKTNIKTNVRFEVSESFMVRFILVNDQIFLDHEQTYVFCRNQKIILKLNKKNGASKIIQIEQLQFQVFWDIQNNNCNSSWKSWKVRNIEKTNNLVQSFFEITFWINTYLRLIRKVYDPIPINFL